MARYSDNREQNLELKYLRKRLLELDEQIVVPESVRGAALRHKLEDVRQHGEARTDFGSRDRGRFTLRTGLAAAALFAVVVGLVYGTDTYRPRMIEGGMTIEQSGSPSAFQNPLSETAQPGQSAVAAAEDTTQPPVASSAAADSQQPPASNEDDGVGGGGEAVLLAEGDGLSFHLRSNDPNDPDKADSAHTLEIIDSGTAQLLGQVNMPDVQTVLDSLPAGQELVLIGETAEGLVAKIYDVADPAVPAEALSLALPGAFALVESDGETVRVYSIGAGELPPECELVPSETADTDGWCLVTSIDPATLETTQIAYAGADAAQTAELLGALINEE